MQRILWAKSHFLSQLYVDFLYFTFFQDEFKVSERRYTMDDLIKAYKEERVIIKQSWLIYWTHGWHIHLLDDGSFPT